MARTLNPARRAEQLRKEIEEHDHRYYVVGEPSVSDQEYDALLRELQELEASHPEIATPDSPTRRVARARCVRRSRARCP